MSKLYFIFVFSSCLLTSGILAQTPSSQPSTRPIGIATDTIITAIDTLPSGLDSISISLDSLQITKDSLSIDSLPAGLDSTRFGKLPPRGKKKKKSKAILSKEVYFFYPEKPEEIFQFVDTTISSPFFQFDPARTGARGYASLGAIGTPLMPLSYEWKDKFGNRAGTREVFEPYLKDESQTKFYTKSKAFSDFYYSQGTEQNDHVFHGDFGRSFDNGIKFSVTHDRLIHSLNNPDLELNSNALYPFAATRNTSLLAGLALQKEGSKYQGFLTYAHNEINQLYNGGILSTGTTSEIQAIDDVIRTAANREGNITIPANITNETANLRYRLRTIALTQFFTLAGANKDDAKSSRIFNIQHKINYTSDIYRFADTRFNDEYYSILATDDRGIRVVLNQRIVENKFGLSTLKTVDGKAIPSPLGDISVGLRHQLARYDGEGYESTFNNLFVEGAWKFSPIKQINVDAFGELGVLDNIGDFRFKAAAQLALDKWGTLDAILRQQRYSPSEFQQQNYITQIQVWNNDFDKSFNSQLGFKYSLPSQKLEAGLSYFLLDNHVFFDESFLPQQRNGAINLVQFYLKKDLKWNIFHLENLIMIQSSDDEVVTLPTWWSRHSFFIQRKIFNNIMLARFGLDLRLNDTYFANNFNPALGQFHLQSTREVDLYPAVDAHFGFVIEEFRIFVRMDNISSFLTDDVFYQIPNNPHKEVAFRFGISWRFLDKNSNRRASNQTNSGNQSSGSPINIPNF